ncbi:hypothetical protein AB7C87_11145 [Natrarchaeobius sp. A-rgal3]|uniref:DUF7289 family protein n=1 Tax=Natrarchaeobius versutus TaxID=1679078 RepID=UPI00350F3C88
MTPGADRLRQALRGDRGVSHVVGFTLLIGIVLMGSVLVLVLGIGLLDSLEADSEAEITYSAIDTTEHSLETTASTGQPQSFPAEGATYRQDGEVHIAWYNETDGISGGNESVEIDNLGAIEYDVEDGIVVYQGGGKWEQTDGQFRTESDPDISYDGQELRLRLLKVTEDDIQGDEGVAQPNYDSDLPERLSEASQNATSKGYNDMVLVIQSEYHDGWADFFSSELDGQTDVTVSQNVQNPEIGPGSDETVQVILENVTDSSADFWIKEDHGVISGEDGENKHVGTDDLEFKATIENVGEVHEEQDVELDIGGDGGPSINETVDLPGGEKTNVTFTLEDPDDHLDQGEEYEYQIYTDQDQLDQPGSFYFSPEPEPYLDIDVPRVDGMDASNEDDPVETTEEEVTIEVDVTNTGGSNLSEWGSEMGELEFSLEPDQTSESDPYDLEGETWVIEERDVGATGTATLTLDLGDLYEGDHEFTISASNGDSATGYFTVPDGIEVGDTEVVVEPGTEVDVSVVGTEVSAEYDWHGSWRKDNPAISVDVKTQPVDENGDSTGEPEKYWDTGWDDKNLNTYQNRWEIWESSFTVEERSSLQLEATSYRRDTCHSWGYKDTVEYDDRYWDIYQCDEDDLPHHTQSNILHTIEADTDSDTAGVRVLSQENNHLPELRGGHYTQLSADEVLERDGVDVEVEEGEDGEGYLQLDDHEYIFVFEITDEPSSGQTADEYWQEAFGEGSDDPNFNDAIAHVEITPPEGGSLDPSFDPGSGSGSDFGPGDESHREQGNISENNIDVGSDEIIIG